MSREFRLNAVRRVSVIQIMLDVPFCWQTFLPGMWSCSTSEMQRKASLVRPHVMPWNSGGEFWETAGIAVWRFAQEPLG